MVTAIRIAETDYPGVTEITAEGWDGRVLRMSHSTCCKWIGSSKIPNTAGVYLLYADHFDRSTHGNQLYVGQTGAIERRLSEHIAKKQFWTAALVFSSRGDWMNIAYTANVEQQFIEWAKLANRYDLDNGNDGGAEHLGKEDLARLQAFLAGVPPVLRLAGVDVFEPNLDGIFSESDHRNPSQLKIAHGQPSPVVTIVAGSRIAGLDDAEVRQANLPGVAYDPTDRVHVFSQTANIAVSADMPRLFGASLSRWKSKAGVSLYKALRSV